MSDERSSETASDPGVALRAVWRALVVGWQFVPFVLAYARDRRRFLLFGSGRPVEAATRRRRASRLRETLVALGPTFIKLGQILSTRPDVLPEAYIDELRELQDRVPPDEWHEVKPVVESAVADVEETFETFDIDPISGASLGQVYEAELDGQRVAVKVLRPGIRRRVEADLRVVSAVTPWLVRFAPPGQAFTLSNLADEFGETIREEMDYAHEAATLRAVHEQFADDPMVVVPSVYDDRSNDRVLVMEYVEGVKIDEVAELDDRGIDPEALVRRVEEAYITMIVEEGLFHADPHPGNLAVQEDGAVVFYDFGMSGELDDATRERMMDFYVAVARDDVDAALDAFVAMGALDPDADRELMAAVFEVAIDQLRGGGVDHYRIAELVTEFQSHLYEFPMRLPKNLALVVRVATVLEGVCRTLVPDFDFVEVVTEYVMAEGPAEEGTRRAVSETVERAAATSRDAVEGLATVPPTLSAVLADLQRGDATVSVELVDDRGELFRLAKRLSLGLLIGANALAVALVYSFQGPRAAAPVAAGVPVIGLLLYRSFRARRGIGVAPKYTRHEIRRKGGE